MKRIYSLLLVFGLVAGLICTGNTADAATAKLNKTKLTLYTGNTYKLKVKGTTSTVKWTSNKKSVATVSAKGKITARKVGKARITAKVDSKKLRCNLTVIRHENGKGTKASPKYAYNSNTFTYYQEGKKMGKFKMKLLRFESGDKAATLAKNNSSNPTPASDQEYIYFKFKITYVSGSQTVSAKDLFNYYYNIYGSNSTVQIENIDWGFFFENVDDLGQTNLSPGNKITCAKAILVKKGYAPYTYRIQTGKNSYTWFTTEK